MLSNYMEDIAIQAARKMPSEFVFEKCVEEAIELIDAIIHRDRSTDRNLPQELADLEVALLITKHHVDYYAVEDCLVKSWEKVKRRLADA